MKTFTGFSQAGDSLRHPAIVLGTFDGVHLGHQALVGEAVRWSRERGVPCVLCTFDPPPVAVLAPALFQAPLTRLSRKLEILGRLGVDAAVVQTFDLAFAQMEAADFMDRSLFGALRPSAVFVGQNFNFGRCRQGNCAALQARCQKEGIHFACPPLVRDQETGIVVSSTEIRRKLTEGDMAAAARLLGRRYALEGQVVHGRARGRGMGFPTANVDASGLFLPRRGVYAALACAEGLDRPLPAVLNLGTKPTFGEADTTLEAFILDGSHQLYGKSLRLELLEHLRDERKFPDAKALSEEIGKDCEAARRLTDALTPPATSPSAPA